MEYSVENNGCRLHVTKQGEGPALLLIHGAGSDSSYFTDAVEYLKKDFMVVTYDRCGYSESVFLEEGDAKPIASRYSVACQAQDAKAVLDLLRIEEAVVAGVSAGGIIALELAQQEPDRILELILYEPALTLGEVPYKADLEQWLADLQDAADRKKLAVALLRFYTVLGGTDPEAPGISLQQQGQNLENLKVFLYHELQDFLTYGERHPEGIRLSVPCVLGAGTRDTDGLCSKAAPMNAKALGCRLSLVDGYHNFAQERPRQFAEWIHEMIDSEIPVS